MPEREIPGAPDFDGVEHTASAHLKIYQHRPKRKWPFEAIFADMRKDGAHRLEQGLEPRWAVIARYSTGTRAERKAARDRDRHNIRAYIIRNLRSELWEVRFRTPPSDEWIATYQMEARFGGFMTDEETEVYWEERRRRAAIVATIKTRNAEKRHLREHAERVAEAEALRQASIRARDWGNG